MEQYSLKAKPCSGQQSADRDGKENSQPIVGFPPC